MRTGLVAALLLIVPWVTGRASAQDASVSNRMARFINDARAKEILTWLYPVSLDYRGAECPSTERRQNDGYTFHCRIYWTNIIGARDSTAIALLFDRNGTFERTVLEERSLAFALSSEVIKRLASILVEDYKQKLTPQQLEMVRSAVESANAQTLMDLTLRFEQ